MYGIAFYEHPKGFLVILLFNIKLFKSFFYRILDLQNLIYETTLNVWTRASKMTEYTLLLQSKCRART